MRLLRVKRVWVCRWTSNGQVEYTAAFWEVAEWWNPLDAETVLTSSSTATPVFVVQIVTGLLQNPKSEIETSN